MTSFSAEVHQNQYLPVGGTRVDAIVRVTVQGGGSARPAASQRAEVLIIDCSGSMRMPRSKIKAARAATAAAIDCIDDGVAFAVVAGTHHVTQVFPTGGGMALANEATRGAAQSAVKLLEARGGTAMGRWLTYADALFAREPAGIHHAILMTDGLDQDETPAELESVLRSCEGHFQCDCRGVGDDWDVDELRNISSALLGNVDIVADPSDAKTMAADFEAMMHSAMGKAVADVALRIWAPRGAEVEFVKQVHPTIEDLSGRRTTVTDLVGDYPTGSWGDELRDFHVRISVPARELGDEMLAGRISLMVDDQAISEAKLLAIWTDDLALSTRIDGEVARADGNAELAEAIQGGVRAWEAGDHDRATALLGRAVQLADAAGDDARLDELSALVRIEDAATGTVVIRPDIDRVAAMTADTHSTKTVLRG
jgi:hypothetical protein